MNWIAQIGKYLAHLRFWYLVQSWERAVRVRMGKHVSLIKPGVHLKIPVFDRLYVVSLRERVLNLPMQSVSIGPGRVVTMAATVRYKVSSPLTVYRGIEDFQRLAFNVCLAGLGRELRKNGSLGGHVVERQATKWVEAQLLDVGLKLCSFDLTDDVETRAYRLLETKEEPWWAGESSSQGNSLP